MTTRLAVKVDQDDNWSSCEGRPVCQLVRLWRTTRMSTGLAVEVDEDVNWLCCGGRRGCQLVKL